eukprot:8306835-Pyramimonas_sp.AAC.1
MWGDPRVKNGESWQWDGIRTPPTCLARALLGHATVQTLSVPRQAGPVHPPSWGPASTARTR